MNNCEYFIGDTHHFKSYTDLLNYLDSKQIDFDKLSITDIVYSKRLKRDSVFNQLLQIKKDYVFQTEVNDSDFTTIYDGEPRSKNGMSILDFLDTPQCAINGKPLITLLNTEDYIKFETEKLLSENNNLKPEEASKIIQDNLKFWKQIQKDSIHLHSLFTNSNIWRSSQDDSDFINEVINSLPNELRNRTILSKLFNSLRYFYIKEKGKYPESKCLSNLNLSSKIEGIGKELLGHVDYLFVGSDGTLHLYLFKTTTQNPNEWTNAKREKYKFQLAFLKSMLANNGVSVKNIDLNLVPVKLDYNDDRSNIENIKILPVEQLSTRYSSGEYSMEKYDKLVKKFITPQINQINFTSDDAKRADLVNKAIFPELNIQEDGIHNSARNWIMHAPNVDPTGTENLVITEVGDIDHGYDVKIGNKTYIIKSRKHKLQNKELIELVVKHLHELEDQKGYSVQKLKDAIEDSYRKRYSTFGEVKGLKGFKTTLDAVLSKYFEYDKENETVTYKWELMDDLIDSNILIFKNRKTGTLDVISLSTFDLNARAGFSKGKNLLGSYMLDSEYIDLIGDYGNIETVRTMEKLNEIASKLSNYTFGTIGILSSTTYSYRKYDIGQFNKNYFGNIISIINKKVPEIQIQNNFSHSKFVDPIENILNEYLSIIQNKQEQESEKYTMMGFDKLGLKLSKDQQIRALQAIMEEILSSYSGFSNPKYVQETIKSSGSDLAKNMAKLYNLVTQAYLNLSGESPEYRTKLNPINKIMFTSFTVDDPNIRTVVNNLQITHDTIASEFLDVYDKHIRKHFDDFYKKAGYSALQNMTIGNQASQYNNFFELDSETGKNLLVFKNPYDYSNNLKTHERELLKHVLYQIAQINHNGNFKFKSSSDPKIKDYIVKHPEYLWVPLERASNATSRQSGKAIVAKMKNSWKRMLKLGQAFDEFVNHVTEEERNLYGDEKDFYKMTLRNPFSLSIPNSESGYSETLKSRQKLIEKYGSEFFETNVENILIDFLAKHISTTQLNKLLVGTKALLLQLYLTGDYSGNQDIVEKEIKYIQDYLKVNVFNTSIMSEDEKKVVGVIYPVKKIVTNMLLGGNLVGMMRDTFEGVQQNFIRSVIKLHTDIDPESVRKAYMYVVKHATSNAMAVNLLSKLCLKYRLSNTDVGRIAERAKSGRNGIMNYDNWLYGTLRSPDFINRMVLFVAKCMHDGVWDAYSIDKDNNLKYDWTKDKRFEIYYQKKINHPDYKKQKSLYLSKIREYNQEHPETPISPDEGLPTPYSDKEIISIRALGDNIYGSYDKGKKAMAEHMSAGIMFGMFTTWMNGISNNYFMTPQKNGISRLKKVQERDEQGNLLFFTDDGGITTEDTGVPVLKNEPMIVQGIMYTIFDIINLCKNDGLDAAKLYLKSNEIARANMRKLESDALMWLLYFLLFDCFITPMYKERKKNMEDYPVIGNLMTEIIFKSTSRSGDQFKGPLNIIQFFGENLNPPFYSQPVQIMKESLEVLLGEKSFKYLLFDNTGFTRSFKDTGFALFRESSEGEFGGGTFGGGGSGGSF